ncbi:MAG TPA: DnaJ domain-containing protein [Sphingomicrobium sp.]|jgi:hypothetical protein|nr:DnaJ domain-containing protein [Sphingomicrobium sp.]
MASSVRALSNHYETLQVSSEATTDEIVEAFASQMRTARMRPDISVVRLAQLSVAYETLRDPAKRRTYDDSIGLGRAPAADSSPFIGAPVIARLNRIAEPSPNKPSPQSPLAQEARPEPRVAAFIAASLREPAEGPDRSEPVSQPQAEPPSSSNEVVETPLANVGERLEIEDGRLSIGRTGATLAAGVIGVAILAFTAALPGRNPDQLPVHNADAETGLTVPVPPATTIAKESLVEAPPLSAPAVAASASPKLQSRPTRIARKPRPAQWLALNEPKPAPPVSERPEQSLTSGVAGAQSSDSSPAVETPAAATESAPVNSAAAALPLANATIARTIERIGYGCGRVVSATGVDGSAGVFTITCSSGDTYRASPVRGRYRFKRMSSH